MRSWLREHGLLVVNLALFSTFIGGVGLAGGRAYKPVGAHHRRRPASSAD